MPGERRAGAAQHAAHVNEAAVLPEAGTPAAEAARVLAGRLGCSQRQARRYVAQAAAGGRVPVPEEGTVPGRPRRPGRDRKSTRLNSSPTSTSYAVFCLQTKKQLQPDIL